MEELKPCPFCGCEDVYVETHWLHILNETTYGIVCNECQSRSSHLFDTKEEAIVAWNTRVGDKE